MRLAKALSQGNNQKVETLRLQYNDITAEGVKQFLHAAQNTLPALRRIELNGNKFMEDDGNVEALRELLENRKEAHGKEDDLENMWGVDELDELEEEAEGEEDEAEITKDNIRQRRDDCAEQSPDENIASLAKDVDQLVSRVI